MRFLTSTTRRIQTLHDAVNHLAEAVLEPVGIDDVFARNRVGR